VFTGIIEEIGEVIHIQKLIDGLEITVSAHKVIDDLMPNDSIAIDGACHTVIRVSHSTFSFQAVGETIQKTTLGSFRVHRKVNLERPLTLNSRLGGHMVQGHINTVTRILHLNRKGENYQLVIDIPSQFRKYCIEEGSITVDGISLTIAKINQSKASMSIIPHTFVNTTLQYKKPGDNVNIEVDIIGRYIESILSNKETDITINKLRDWGY